MGKHAIDTWLAMEPFMFPREKWQDARRETDDLIRLLDLGRPSKILDLPCGLGRHSLLLAQQGHQLTGVDITPEFLDDARRRAQVAGVSAEWVQGDMRSFCQIETFDVALNLYTSFGYFKDPADDVSVLRNFFKSLKPHGRLLMDLMSREIFSNKFKGHTRKEQNDGTLLLSEHAFTEQRSWLESSWTHISATERNEAKMGLRLYTRGELCTLLHEVGFVDLEIYGDFDGRAYHDQATHLVVVAKKPGIQKS